MKKKVTCRSPADLISKQNVIVNVQFIKEQKLKHSSKIQGLLEFVPYSYHKFYFKLKMKNSEAFHKLLEVYNVIQE